MGKTCLLPVTMSENDTTSDLERDIELIVVFAKSTSTNYLLIIGSGSDHVEIYTINVITLVIMEHLYHY